MKNKLLTLCLFVAFWGAASAQQELTPPKFNGADVEYFMRRLVGEFEKVAVERQIPAAEISPRVAVAFKVDSTGGVSEWRFRDNASEGRDRTDLPTASDATREAMTEAFSRLKGWMPAVDAEGCKTDYTLRLTLRLPVEKIVRKQDPDPLLFLGEDPGKSFYAWAYDGCAMTSGLKMQAAWFMSASTSNLTAKSPSAMSRNRPTSVLRRR